MKLRGLSAAVCALALLGAAPAPTIYSAPAGSRVAGAPNPADPYDVILPNGRTVSPIGKSVVIGMNALGVALSPDGRYAVVTNDDEREGQAVSHIVPAARGGYSLAVVNTSTMAVTDVYRGEKQTFFLGVVALKDPANPSQTLVIVAGGANDTVRFLRLDGRGKLHDTNAMGGTLAVLAPPRPTDPRYANQNHAFPGWIALSANHRIAYVVNDLANTVTAIDIAKRTLLHTVPVGYFPYGAAVAGHRLYVTDPGLMTYGNLPQPVRYPSFSNVPFKPQSASALSSIPLAAGGDVATSGITSTPMDSAPDGTQNVGGAHPGAIAISKNGRFGFVCMTNVDRIATVESVRNSARGRRSAAAAVRQIAVRHAARRDRSQSRRQAALRRACRHERDRRAGRAQPS